jgi:hypothetical protein
MYGRQKELPKELNNDCRKTTKNHAAGKQPAADVGRQDTGRLWNMIP